MKGATLFSGIGAPECAAPFIDWRWAAEMDDFASAVHAHRFPNTPNLGDVTKLKGQDIERPDVIVFGSPCQSFSVAGKRLGLADPRGNLALIALALVAELRPRWFVFENVPGLLSSADGEDFAAFLRAVRQCGYTGAYGVLDAQHFGVPQRRRRVFFVGHLGDDWRPSAAVLFEPESLSGHPPPGREAGEDVAGTLKEGSGSRGWANGAEIVDRLVASTGTISHCLNARGMGRQDFETETLVAFNARQDPDHWQGHTGPLDQHGGTQAVAFQERGREDGRSLEWLAEQAYALTSPNGGGRAQERNICAGPVVRRLTPTECERLQGFPDRFTDIPWRGKPAPDGRRYKALGNSMAVPVLRWILERLWVVDMETREWRAAA